MPLLNSVWMPFGYVLLKRQCNIAQGWDLQSSHVYGIWTWRSYSVSVNLFPQLQNTGVNREDYALWALSTVPGTQKGLSQQWPFWLFSLGYRRPVVCVSAGKRSGRSLGVLKEGYQMSPLPLSHFIFHFNWFKSKRVKPWFVQLLSEPHVRRGVCVCVRQVLQRNLPFLLHWHTITPESRRQVADRNLMTMTMCGRKSQLKLDTFDGTLQIL